MRTWRVGTFSMGFSLVFAGVSLLVSLWKGASVFDTLIAWWPIVFVLLGCEILLYLWASKKEKPAIRYDLASMLVVGSIGMMSVAFSFLASTGILSEIRQAVSAVETTEELTPVRQSIPQEVKRIVVQTPDRNLKVDRTAGRELNLFGNYRSITYRESDAKMPTARDAASVRTIGDTMYVSIKEQPRERGLRSYYTYANISLVLPQDMPVELRSLNNQPILPEPPAVQR